MAVVGARHPRPPARHRAAGRRDSPPRGPPPAHARDRGAVGGSEPCRRCMHPGVVRTQVVRARRARERRAAAAGWQVPAEPTMPRLKIRWAELSAASAPPPSEAMAPRRRPCDTGQCGPTQARRTMDSVGRSQAARRGQCGPIARPPPLRPSSPPRRLILRQCCTQVHRLPSLSASSCDDARRLQGCPPVEQRLVLSVE